MSLKSSWSPSAEYCAQSAHYLAGALVVLAAEQHGLSLFWTAIVFISVTAFKEFVADMTFWEHDTLAGSALDWTCYQLGLLAGLLALCHLPAAALATVAYYLIATGLDMVS